MQFYSTNPRNSAINIRGLGAPFGLTNDGLEPGVGLYIDGVFYARPASATLDFLDVERIEVLRGPQGTLFGKNTTAGAINVTTRKPSFTRGGDFELNVGDLGFVQAKASATTPLGSEVAGRVSFSGTQRDGTVYNVADAGRRQRSRQRRRSRPAADRAVRPGGDRLGDRLHAAAARRLHAGRRRALRRRCGRANRQFPQIAADLGYTPPSYNAFDRVTDVDTAAALVPGPRRLGGQRRLEGRRAAVLTSTTGWRFWNWNPSNDRDFIGLPITTVSAAPSKQRQWSQEIRYAGDRSRRGSASSPARSRSTRRSTPIPRSSRSRAPRPRASCCAPTANAATPGLLDGYGFDQFVDYGNTSAAVFGQVDLALTDRLRLLPGAARQLRPEGRRLRSAGLRRPADDRPCADRAAAVGPRAAGVPADVDDTNLSGQLTAAYAFSKRVNAYATYATGFKSVGLNLNGVPTDALNRPVISAATVKPEDVRNIEVGIKTEPLRGLTANLTAYDTDIEDFQTQVTNASVGVLRGYLANAERVRVRGVELDTQRTAASGTSRSTAPSPTPTASYVTFPDAPPPLEDTGGPQSKDISGSLLPGISKWAVSVGGEYAPSRVAVRTATATSSRAADVSYRSSFSSSASFSRYLVVDGYHVLNTRIGFRAADGWTVFVWSRNLLDKDYFELLTAAPGNTGLYVGQPGDGRTAGITLRVALKSR